MLTISHTHLHTLLHTLARAGKPTTFEVDLLFTTTDSEQEDAGVQVGGSPGLHTAGYTLRVTQQVTQRGTVGGGAQPFYSEQEEASVQVGGSPGLRCGWQRGGARGSVGGGKHGECNTLPYCLNQKSCKENTGVNRHNKHIQSHSHTIIPRRLT